MDRGAWRATFHGAAKSQSQLSSFVIILLYYAKPWHPCLLTSSGEGRQDSLVKRAPPPPSQSSSSLRELIALACEHAPSTHSQDGRKHGWRCGAAGRGPRAHGDQDTCGKGRLTLQQTNNFLSWRSPVV